MASLFPESEGNCYFLDAGAGIGSLSAAFLERWKAGKFHFQRVKLDAFEIDHSLHPYLSKTLNRYSDDPDLTLSIYGKDFINAATDWLSGNLFAESFPQYTHVLLNPPYKKINSHSPYRLALRSVGIETVNLYAAFLALAVMLTGVGGQIVAIIPRSFCNGPYYRSFRDLILEYTAIRHIHLFESRSKAFKDDDVLQENIIIRLERGGRQGPVTISTSTDDTFNNLVSYEWPFAQIVPPDETEKFIHIPSSSSNGYVRELPSAICYSLAELGIQVSTGPVVDFRLKAYLRDMPEADTVPLLYPNHFSKGGTTWPLTGNRKSNAIVYNSNTEKWLYPIGFYCIVRRFSSKEEKRRIVANVVDPSVFGEIAMLGFENHLNIFHQNKRGLPQTLAYGLAVFLNTTALDRYFRRFSGHTQVNVTDLKLLKYPSHDTLIAWGQWAIQQQELTQAMMDAQLATLTE
nr:Eco57I restriction-modification methylase domain-containing protein [Trichothermofontia sichuanensis]